MSVVLFHKRSSVASAQWFFRPSRFASAQCFSAPEAVLARQRSAFFCADAVGRPSPGERSNYQVSLERSAYSRPEAVLSPQRNAFLRALGPGPVLGAVQNRVSLERSAFPRLKESFRVIAMFFRGGRGGNHVSLQRSAFSETSVSLQRSAFPRPKPQFRVSAMLF